MRQVLEALPFDLHRVGREGGVNGDNGDGFGSGLGDEEAVEGIAVVEGQARDFFQMGDFDGQQRDVVGMQLSGKCRLEWLRQV